VSNQERGFATPARADAKVSAAAPGADAVIVLATFNARYAHTALALRCLQANLGSWRGETAIVEFTLEQRPLDALEQVLALRPRIIGLSVYLWNRSHCQAFAEALRQVAPGIRLVLGGPEVSFAPPGDDLVQAADYVIVGEGEQAFATLCGEILAGRAPTPGVVVAPLPQWSALELPYADYTEMDLRQRTVYVEASRGCPFRCAFCLSADEPRVRRLPPARLHAALDTLWRRGARAFKFLDRTFNAHLPTALAHLHYLHALGPEVSALHFEIAPHLVSTPLIAALAAFAPGVVQVEAGVQSLDAEVWQRIGRRGDPARALAGLQRLRQETGVHIHADLIVGLPGEDLAAFGRGFDALMASGAHEIQVGILKRLWGTPLARQAEGWSLVFAAAPPYEVLQTPHLTFQEVMHMRRFARFWDLWGNSGHFTQSLALWWQVVTPFAGFLAFSQWLHGQGVGGAGVSLQRRFELIFSYLTTCTGLAPPAVAEALLRDYLRAGRDDLPPFLRPFLPAGRSLAELRDQLGCPAVRGSKGQARQARHL